MSVGQSIGFEIAPDLRRLSSAPRTEVIRCRVPVFAVEPEMESFEGMNTFEILTIVSLVVTVVTLVVVVALYMRLPRVFDGVSANLREEHARARQESQQASKSLREEVSGEIARANQTQLNALAKMSELQQQGLREMSDVIKNLSDSNRSSLDRIRNSFDERVRELQEGNEKKLEEMRRTVDEKLHDTLEKRLGESFKLVSDRLEAVHNGLGEMRNLATGVGDLKKVLTNVKVRGTWAEVQLGAILEQILTPAQFERNVRVNSSSQDVVEFAVKLPGRDGDSESCVWLPIDSKFPQEDYLRIQAASENNDPEAVRAATNELAKTIRISAKYISDKYIDPPNTTDFAIMFLGTEGLYAEAVRIPDLISSLQNDHRVVIAGPTTIAAILSSLRMGFQTIAIERRASEVWKVLGAVKNEFGKFGDVLEKVKRKLESATESIDKTGVRTRAIARKLREVEELPGRQSDDLLQLGPSIDADILDDDADEEPED